MGKRTEIVEVGSGDVFIDLGFQDAGERKLRVQLAMRVNELLQEHKFTQVRQQFCSEFLSRIYRSLSTISSAVFLPNG